MLKAGAKEKGKLFENSGDPDQMPYSVASNLDPHCLPITFWGSPD